MSGGGSDAHTGLKIGQALALARRKRNLSLEEAEEATKIRAAYLRELERENFDVLPAVYVRGSLKTYANFLQLDGDALVRELKRRRAAVEEPRDPAPDKTRENDALDRRAAILAAAASPEKLLEDREESRALPASLYGYLALGFTVFVVLALVAAVLVSTLAWEEEPAVSKVHEPLIAQAPEASLVAADEPADDPPTRQEDARKPDVEEDGPEKGSRSASRPARDGGEERAAPSTAQVLATPAPDARRPAARRPARTAAPRAAFPPAPRENAGTAPAPVERSPSPSPPPGVPAPQGGAVPESNAPASGPVTSEPGGDFEVRIEVGGDDPVQITGNPAGDP